MKDKNGIEMKTGQVVRIEGAYFKCDNGLYFIAAAPGDPTWLGSDLSLHKINAKGTPKEKHAVGFWPLSCFVSSRDKRLAAHEHNEKHATIEVLDSIPMDGIRNFFEEKYRNSLDVLNWEERQYGKQLSLSIDISNFYKAMATSFNG